MFIRVATKNDLKEIAEVHKQYFPNSFSTQLGVKLLKQYYLEYLERNPDLFWVSVVNNNIVGFCMGYLLSENSYIKDFYKHNFWQIACRCLLLLLTGNKLFFCKLKKMLYHDDYTIVDQNIHNMNRTDLGDLLSICVLPEYRGSGIAKAMIERYLEKVKEKGCKACLLSVESGNHRAIRFYEKSGFQLCRTSKFSCTYAKKF